MYRIWENPSGVLRFGDEVTYIPKGGLRGGPGHPGADQAWPGGPRLAPLWWPSDPPLAVLLAPRVFGENIILLNFLEFAGKVDLCTKIDTKGISAENNVSSC